MRSIHLAGAFMLHLREAFTWCMNLFHIRVSMNSLHSHSFTLFPKSWREKGSIFVYRKGYTHEFILTKLLIHWVGQCFQKCLLSHSFTLFPESWREKTTFFVYSWVVYSWELNMVYTYEVIIRHIIRQLHTHYTHTTPAISLFFFFLFFSRKWWFIGYLFY